MQNPETETTTTTTISCKTLRLRPPPPPPHHSSQTTPPMSPDLAPPMRHGPMYWAYAELRECRRKMAGIKNHQPPISTRNELKHHHQQSLSALPPSGLKSKIPSSTTQPPLNSKIKHQRSASVSLGTQRMMAEPKRAGSRPVSGGGVVSLTRSYSCFEELDVAAVVVSVDRDHQERRSGHHEAELSRSGASFRRQSSSSSRMCGDVGY